jgi:alpha-beta hydrolase superfamily lysophospholipase
MQPIERRSDGPDTIVLIHGLWLSPKSWEHWIDRYSRAGYTVVAPGWPGVEGSVAQLRADTRPYERLGLPDILNHYVAIVEKMPRPPIIMGHSFGGGFTEVLIDRGFGAAGVAIEPAALKGVFRVPFSTVRSAWPVLKNPANRDKAVMLTRDQFKYAFANTLSEEESRVAYEQYAIPGPGRVLIEGAMVNLKAHTPLAVNFHNASRAPLLIVGGGSDHIVPASVAREAKGRYRGAAVTEYREYPGKSHFMIGERGWEEVADYALAWAVEQANNRQTARRS